MKAKKSLRVVLCSGSPRRKEMLRDLGISFEIQVSRIREIWDRKTPPTQFVVQLAKRKASACNTREVLSIGMDTVVVVGKTILGKPSDAREAEKMLKALSNRVHRVVTGVAVVWKGELLTDSESTKVYFRRLNPTEVKWYIETGEPFDKAGGYAIQGLGRIFIKKIDGCYFNVVGFPVTCFQRVLKAHGLTIFDLM